MTKVLIPFSGGVNSTYALWKWLSQTDHDITALFAEEDWITKKLDDPNRHARENEAVDQMAAWLKSNVRDFSLTKTTWSGYEKNERPLRVGFTNTHDFGIFDTRYRGYAAAINEHSPDKIVLGRSLENTSIDGYDHGRLKIEGEIDIHFAGSRDFDPIAQGDDFNYTNLVNMSGRFEQLDALPTALKEMIPPKCSEYHSLYCHNCAYDRVYKESGKTGAELDQIMAEHGSYGRWRDEADPKTYQYRGIMQHKVIELLGADE